MNPTLVLGLWRQRIASPIRAVILALMVGLPPLLLLAVPGVGLAALGDGVPLAVLFAAGMIGQDVSSGVLQLVLARPVRRWEYVVSRWLGAASGATAASLLQLVLAWGVLVLRDAPPDPSQVGWMALGRVLQIFGVAAVIALLSTLIGGVGDLALYVMLNIGGGMLVFAGQMRQFAPAVWAGEELGALLGPKLDVAALAAGSAPWLPLVTYASNVTLCLLLAVVVMNRKELSYASASG